MSNLSNEDSESKFYVPVRPTAESCIGWGSFLIGVGVTILVVRRIRTKRRRN